MVPLGCNLVQRLILINEAHNTQKPHASFVYAWHEGRRATQERSPNEVCTKDTTWQDLDGCGDQVTAYSYLRKGLAGKMSDTPK